MFISFTQILIEKEVVCFKVIFKEIGNCIGRAIQRVHWRTSTIER